MNTKHRFFPAAARAAGGLLLLGLLAGPALRAQTAPPPAPPGTYAAAPVPAADATQMQADVLFPYAFRFNTTGIVGDVGGTWAGNFIGGEFSYYDARPRDYAWYNPGGLFGGDIPYRDNIYTLNLAYRYRFPLWTGGAAGNPVPLEGYVGAGAGAAWLDFRSSGAPDFPGGPGYSDTNRGRFDADGVAGLQWNFTRALGLRAGYRFIWIDRAHLFYTPHTAVDSGAFEAGLAFRF
ncbi:MAG TPA: outer membrane beta-barrel protein [Opitutaceae bacterium]|jgi:opacity protein-like surface antigen|nr:outer membrane beta-barrel protein [Opitutaceae bacterium]